MPFCRRRCDYCAFSTYVDRDHLMASYIDAVRRDVAQAVDSLDDQPLGYRVNILIARLCFRGIYFPMLGRFAWCKVISENRGTIMKLARQGFEAWRGSRSKPEPAPATSAGD